MEIQVNTTALSLSDMLTKIKLDYSVTKEPIFLNDGTRVVDKFATVRNDKIGFSKILGVVGTRYNVIQNVEALSILDDVVKDGEAIYHSAGIIGNGEKMWVQTKLPEMYYVNPEDKCEKFINLVNTHDGSGSMFAKFGIRRLVCNNQFSYIARDNGQKITIRHTKSSSERIAYAYRLLGLAKDTFKAIEQNIGALSLTEISEGQLIDYIKTLIVPKGVELIDLNDSLRNKFHSIKDLTRMAKGQDSNKITLWSAVNGITEYVDHYARVRGDRDASILFGTGDALKSKAFDLAVSRLN